MLALVQIFRPMSAWFTAMSAWAIGWSPRMAPGDLGAVDSPSKISAREWLDFQWAFGIVVLMMVGIVSESFVIGLAAGAGAWMMPRFWLKEQAAVRQRMGLRMMPNTLDLLTACAEAGLTFDAALAKVVEFTSPTLLRAEMAQYLYEVQVGKPRREAMKAMAARVNLREFTTFISSVGQAEQLGTSLAEGLKIQAAEMRVKWRQAMEKQAMEAPVKLLFPLTLFIFPTTFLIIFGPLLIRFMEGF